MKWMQDALTGKDNLTYDAARIVGVVGAVAYIGARRYSALGISVRPMRRRMGPAWRRFCYRCQPQ